MQNKPLLFGLIGFLLGGLLVSVAATTFQKPVTNMGDMAKALQSKKGEAYDKAFVDMMIQHHQSAVDMAQLSQARADHQEVKQLSRDIILAQQKEISEMQQWQKQWGYKSTPAQSTHSGMDMQHH